LKKGKLSSEGVSFALGASIAQRMEFNSRLGRLGLVSKNDKALCRWKKKKTAIREFAFLEKKLAVEKGSMGAVPEQQFFLKRGAQPIHF